MVGGAPGGSLTGFEVVEIQGITLEITTTVEWVGSNHTASGFFGGDDGVQGAVDLGANYKWVEVSIRPANNEIDPIVFNTAIAPPYVSNGSELYGSVAVAIEKHEPIGSPTNNPDFPSLYLIGPAGTFTPSVQLSSPGLYVCRVTSPSPATTSSVTSSPGRTSWCSSCRGSGGTRGHLTRAATIRSTAMVPS